MLKEAFENYAKTLDRPWSHDRTKSVGSSEIGLCARKVFWQKFAGTAKGQAQDIDFEEQWGARLRGTIMEQAWWTPALRHAFGDNLLWSGGEQRTLISGFLSSTPDALVINQPRDALKHLGIEDIGEGQCFPAEGKTIDPRANITDAKIENYMQTVAQMGLIRECTEYKPEYTVLTYTDASFWSIVTEFVVPFDQQLYDTAKIRAAAIINADSGSELKPEGWIAGAKECAFCPFTRACGVERRQVPQHNVRATPQFVAEIADYARQANQLAVEVEHHSALLKDVQNTIKERLKEKGVKRIDGVVNWYMVNGRISYKVNDMCDRLTALGVDTDPFQSVGQPSDRLVISATIPAENYRPAITLPLQPGKKVKRGHAKRKIKKSARKKARGRATLQAKTSNAKARTVRSGKASRKSTKRTSTRARRSSHD